MSNVSLRLLCPIIAMAAATRAFAGPPFVSDDPEPTEFKHWEIYGFAAGTHMPGGTEGGAGLDINYGAAKDLQLTAVLPLDYRAGHDGRIGVGNVEVAAKYKFLHQRAGSILPDVAFFPRAFAPTSGRSFGTGRLILLLPMWAQKDMGPWALFGGGGYGINPGRDQRNFWLTGIGLSRTIGERWLLGGEVYRQTADAADARRFTGVSIGGAYRITGHWSLLASAGPGIEHARSEGQYSFYFSLKADY